MSLLKTENTLIVKKTRNIKRLKKRIPSYYCNFKPQPEYYLKNRFKHSGNKILNSEEIQEEIMEETEDATENIKKYQERKRKSLEDYLEKTQKSQKMLKEKMENKFKLFFDIEKVKKAISNIFNVPGFDFQTLNFKKKFKTQKEIYENYLILTALVTHLDEKCNQQDKCEAGYVYGAEIPDGKKYLKAGQSMLKSLKNNIEGENQQYQLDRNSEYGVFLRGGFMVNIWEENKFNVNMLIPEYKNDFYPNLYDKFNKLLYDKEIAKEEDENYKSTVFNPFLFYFYIMDKENREIVSSNIVKYVNMIYDCIDKTRVNNLIKLPEGTIENIFDMPYAQKSEISLVPEDLSQGTTWTYDSKRLFMLLISSIMSNSYEIKTLTIDWDKDLPHSILTVYEWMCEEQESHLKNIGKETIPYSLSEWGKTGGFLPQILHHVPQSLEHLNIRKTKKGKVVCSACKEKYTTYYGANYVGSNKKRPNKGPYNTTGKCTEWADEILDLAGITEEEKNNPWYLNFIGTYEQAARRLHKFEEKQAEMYDNNDPNYSFVHYYVQLICLKFDYWMKKLFNVCNVKVDDTGDENKELTEEEKKKWGWVNKSLKTGGGTTAGAAIGAGLGSVVPVLGTAAGGLIGGLVGAITTSGNWSTVAEYIKIGGLMMYKIILMILRCPIVFEKLLEYAKKYKQKICEKMAIEKNKISIARTTDDGNVEELNDWGEWLKMSDEKKEKVAKKEQEIQTKKEQEKIRLFYGVVESMCGSEGDSYLKSGLGTISLCLDNAFSGVIGLITMIPGMKSILKTINLDEKKLEGIILLGISTQAKESFNEIVKQNQSFQRLRELYDTIINGSENCLTDGKLVIKDGGLLGDGDQYMNYAWEAMNFNIPFYSLMILNNLALKNIFPWSPNYETEKRLAIDTLIATQSVPGGYVAAQYDEKARKAENKTKKNWAKKRENFKKALNIEDAWFKIQYNMHKATKALQVNNRVEQTISQKKWKKESDELLKKLKEFQRKIDKVMEEDEINKWKWIGIGVIAAVSVGAFVATGGASVVLQAAYGSAAAGLGSASAALGGAAASVGTTASAIAGSTAFNTAMSVAGGAVVNAWRNASTTDKTIVMLAGSALCSRVLQQSFKGLVHMFDYRKTFIIQTVCSYNKLWADVFINKLNSRIDKMGRKENEKYDLQLRWKSVKYLRECLLRQESFSIEWYLNKELPFLDLPYCIKIFEKYGQAIVD